MFWMFVVPSKPQISFLEACFDSIVKVSVVALRTSVLETCFLLDQVQRYGCSDRNRQVSLWDIGFVFNHEMADAWDLSGDDW